MASAVLVGGPFKGRRFHSYPRTPKGDFQDEILMVSRDGNARYALTDRRRGKAVVYKYDEPGS